VVVMETMMRRRRKSEGKRGVMDLGRRHCGWG
jgi:hypothetical protein